MFDLSKITKEGGSQDSHPGPSVSKAHNERLQFLGALFGLHRTILQLSSQNAVASSPQSFLSAPSFFLVHESNGTCLSRPPDSQAQLSHLSKFALKNNNNKKIHSDSLYHFLPVTIITLFNHNKIFYLALSSAMNTSLTSLESSGLLSTFYSPGVTNSSLNLKSYLLPLLHPPFSLGYNQR